MDVGELCNREVVIASPDLSVLDAAKRMREYHVGDLVLVESINGERQPVGIVTDRDLVVEVLAENVSWASALRVGEVMTCELVTANEDEDPATVLRRMRSHNVRRIPIVDARGTLQGILTFDDIVEWLAEELGDLVSIVANQRQVEAERTRLG